MIGQPGDALAGGDGLGPVFNERSCVACHFQGGVGGGGDAKHNVASFEVHPVPGRPEVMAGVLHSFALSKDCRESRTGLHDFFAVVPGGLKIVGGCRIEIRDFDPVRIHSVNATALFGAGWIDRISSKSIVHQSRSKAFAAIGKELLADLDGVKGGRPRVLADGRIGKFGWKAQFATLEEFVASACANELGLGNPMMEQAKPWAHGSYAKVDPDLGPTQFRSLVAFVDTLPRPIEVMPLEANERARRGARKDIVRAGRLRGVPYPGDRGSRGHLQRFSAASSHRHPQSGQRLCRSSHHAVAGWSSSAG